MVRQRPTAAAMMKRSETFPSAFASPAAVVAPRARHPSDSDGEVPEGYVPPPQRQNISDFVASALDRAAGSVDAGNGGGKKGKKGKKKNKGMTFSLSGGGPQI